MNFELTDEQKDIKDAARKFAEGEFADLKAELSGGEFPWDIWKKACELGFVGIAIPEEYGGAGLGTLENVLVVEEMYRVNPGLAGAVMLSAYGSELIVKFGGGSQKEKYLRPLAEGRALMSFSYIDAGDEEGERITDDMQSGGAEYIPMAEQSGEGWVISGEVLIAGEVVPNYAAALCLTNPNAEHADKQLSIIMVETDREGCTPHEPAANCINGAPPTLRISLNNVGVPSENVIGIEDNGFEQTAQFLNISMIKTAAQAVGTAQGALDRSIKYIKEREGLSQPTWHYQRTSLKLAEIAAEVEAARLLTHKAAWTADHGRPNPMLTAMARWKAGQTAINAVEEAVMLHEGVWGHLEDYRVEKFMKDAKIAHRSPRAASTRDIKISDLLYEGAAGMQKYMNG